MKWKKPKRSGGRVGNSSTSAKSAFEDNFLDHWYAEHYDAVVYSGASRFGQRMFHAAVERPWKAAHEFPTVLDLGATSGEHLGFVRHEFSRYIMVDFRDSPDAHESAARASRPGAMVEFMVGDAENLASIPDESVDRLISMCLLHHLHDPKGALHHWRRVVKPGGTLSIFLPCDPGLIFRLGRRLTTFRTIRAMGYSYLETRVMYACDHPNQIASLRWMIEGEFSLDDISIHRFPFGPLDSWNANLFMTFQIKKRL
jgi:phosphatidylethanolamine/phosphatidyl-N-methylethanolamine N-methyltransferase